MMKKLIGTLVVVFAAMGCSLIVPGAEEGCEQEQECTADHSACDTGLLGVCKSGIFTCEGNELVCGYHAEPSEEVCDGADNDCDGEVDEGCDVVTCNPLPSNHWIECRDKADGRGECAIVSISGQEEVCDPKCWSCPDDDGWTSCGTEPADGCFPYQQAWCQCDATPLNQCEQRGCILKPADYSEPDGTQVCRSWCDLYE